MNNIMTSQDSSTEIDIVHRYLTAFSQNNIQDALECIHQNAIWHVDGHLIVKTVGIIQGHQAIKRWLEDFPKAFQPLNFSIHKMISAEQDVFVNGRFRHLVLKTNTIVDSDYIIKFTIKENKIIHYQIFEDSLLLSEVHSSSSHNRKVNINGTTYEWDDIGNGSPIIFLHGLFLDRNFWGNITQSLPKNRCISFDMPEHAKNSWCDHLDLDVIAEDIIIWMKEYCIEKPTLVGHDQGGMLAMRIAAQYPELVDNLVLINTSARKECENRIPTWLAREKILLSNHSDKLALFKEIQKFKKTAQWLKNNSKEAEIELNDMMSIHPQNLAKALRCTVINRSDIRDKITQIKAKTIVLSGEIDRVTPSELGQEIADLIPNAKHKILTQVSHSIPTESPQTVLDAIRNLCTNN